MRGREVDLVPARFGVLAAQPGQLGGGRGEAVPQVGDLVLQVADLLEHLLRDAALEPVIESV